MRVGEKFLGYGAEEAALWQEVVVEFEWRGADGSQTQADDEVGIAYAFWKGLGRRVRGSTTIYLAQERGLEVEGGAENTEMRVGLNILFSFLLLLHPVSWCVRTLRSREKRLSRRIPAQLLFLSSKISKISKMCDCMRSSSRSNLCPSS